MMRRIVLFFIAPLMVLIILLGVALTWVVTTESGLRTAWQLARGFAPGLNAEAIEGRLTGPLKLRGLRFESETFQLLIRAAEFDWLPSSLLQRDLVIERLHVSGVQYTQLKHAPPSENEEPFSLPERVDLPVSIALRDIALDTFEFRAQPDAEPFVVDSAELQAGFANSKLQIARLFATGPLFELDGQASMEASSDYASTVKLDWQARPPGYAPLAGSTGLQGDLADLQVTQTLKAPYNVALDARLHDIIDELKFKATLAVNETELRAISESLPDINLNATANAGGALTDLGLSVDLTADAAELGIVNLTMNGGFEQQLLTIKQLVVTVADTPAKLQAQGQVNLAEAAPTLNVDANWESIRWPLQGAAPTVASPVGKFSLAGTLQDYTVHADAKLKLPQETDGHLLLDGKGSSESLKLQTIRLDVLDGQIDGNADVVWQPNVQAKVNLRGKNLDPGIIAQDWPGNLQFELAADADQRDEKTAAKLQKFSVTGRLRNQPVDLQVLGELSDQVLRISRLNLQSGPSKVSAKGKLGETLGLDWNIDSPDLATLLPQASGMLKGEGKLSGKLPWPTVTAELQGEKIRYADYSIDELALDADVDFQRTTPSTLNLVAKGGAAAGVKLDNLTLKGSGTREDHHFSLQATSSVGAADVNLTGKFADENWGIQLTEAELSYDELDAWTLAAPQAAAVSADKQSLQRGCWTSGEAKICLQGERTDTNLQASAQITTLPFAYFDKIVPTDIAMRGVLNGDAEISQRPGEEPEVDLDFNTTASELRTRGAEDQPGDTLLALEPANIKATLDEKGLSALLDLPFVEQGGIKGKLTVPAGDAALTERPLTGTIDIAIEDLGFIAALSPEIEQASGGISGDMQLAGTLAKPLPSGKLLLSNGSIELAAPGLKITDLELQATASDDGGVEYTAGATSGKGTINVFGDANLSGDSITTKMTVTGKDFQVFNTQDAQVYASPDLKIAVDEKGVAITGEVLVPRAEITPKELPASAVAVSQDQVIIMDESEDTAAAAQRELHAKVKLILGDAVTVDGFGFKGGVTGELKVTQNPGEPTTGSGELNIVDGEYRAYGQGLVVEKGLILFAGGPVAQPGINVRAVRRPAEDITVGVQVRGSLQQPDFTVFSEPAMSQSEQISWLVLGRPLEDTSDAEGDMVSQAAMALGVKGGNFLADQFGGDLGVDNIGIETGSGEAGAASDVNQAAFVIGKYLSPELYVSYGIGLFESISTVKLEYTLNEHWKVSTESSTLSSGGDVKYTIER